MGIRLIVDGSVFYYQQEKVIAEVTGNTIGECIDDLICQKAFLKDKLLDENGKPLSGLLLSRNGQFSYGNSPKEEVEDEDEIGIRLYRGC